MAIKKNDPPRKGKTTLGAGAGTGITKYAAENAKQKAIKEAARKSAAAAVAKKPAAKKPAPAPKKVAAPAPKKAAAPAPATAPAVAAPKKPANQRAFMDVDMGKNSKGMAYTMSLDTTNMSNPKRFDSDTYNYVMKDSTGKVTRKGNIARGNSKYDTKKAVEYLKTKAKK
jgi:membrane protein involved in colicin uptake